MANIFDYVKYTDNWQKKTLPKIEMPIIYLK